MELLSVTSHNNIDFPHKNMNYAIISGTNTNGSIRPLKSERPDFISGLHDVGFGPIAIQ